MTGLGWLAVGAVSVAVPAFWWARLHRAHRDYKTAQAAVPKARAARTAAATSFLKTAAIATAVFAVAAYAATHDH